MGSGGGSPSPRRSWRSLRPRGRAPAAGAGTGVGATSARGGNAGASAARRDVVVDPAQKPARDARPPPRCSPGARTRTARGRRRSPRDARRLHAASVRARPGRSSGRRSGRRAAARAAGGRAHGAAAPQATATDPEHVEPGPDVAAAVAADDARVAADGEHHPTPRAGELVGDLVAGRARADDQDAARWQRRRLRDTGQRAAARPRAGAEEANHGTAGHGTVARGHDDVAGLPVAAVRADAQTAHGALDRGHGRALVDRGAERPRVALQRATNSDLTGTHPDRPAPRRAAAGSPSWGSAAQASPTVRCATARRRGRARARRGRVPHS